MTLANLLLALGEEIGDPQEETFLLFSISNSSQNLGIVDDKAITLEIPICGRDLTILQSPGLLTSKRERGTTGAVVWKITPLFAEWITQDDNILFQTSVLRKDSQVIELGCGISGINAIMLSRKVGRYVVSDQDYVLKLLKSNIKNNKTQERKSPQSKSRKQARPNPRLETNIEAVALDWESSLVSNLSTETGKGSIDMTHPLDAIIACDCIYNENLIEPFVRTCVDLCRSPTALDKKNTAICVVAQQLRSDLVFEAWMLSFHREFRTWRVPDELLTAELRQGSNFVVHIGLLR